ncbi:MAG: hypothetical protein NVV74_12685 [Magnetospirillum sp.]|nr:hypothetical protein [Magnetospirillum sp.]
MDLEETPLLHFPDLVRALLRAGRDTTGTLSDAAALLAEDRAQAREHQHIDAAELISHLDRARRHLVAARALEMLDAGSFRATPRGRALLRGHPEGIDDGVLMEFPEFRAWMHHVFRRPAPEDPRPLEFLDGWSAGQRGRDLGDNPFPPDTAQHAAWVDGWLEADRSGRD